MAERQLLYSSFSAREVGGKSRPVSVPSDCLQFTQGRPARDVAAYYERQQIPKLGPCRSESPRAAAITSLRQEASAQTLRCLPQLWFRQRTATRQRWGGATCSEPTQSVGRVSGHL